MTPLPPSPAVAVTDADADDRTLTLLLKAVDALPAGERTEVLMFLLKRGLGAAQEAPTFFSVGSSVERLGALGVTLAPAQPPGKPEKSVHQMVPVRFSADSHQRLRTWCGANGYPMAAVVRGLVDQFLDDRGQPRRDRGV